MVTVVAVMVVAVMTPLHNHNAGSGVGHGCGRVAWCPRICDRSPGIARGAGVRGGRPRVACKGQSKPSSSQCGAGGAGEGGHAGIT